MDLKINIENLKIAVEGVKKLNLNLEQFDMYRFNGLDNLDKSEYDNLPIYKCDTIACFAGWFPWVEKLTISKEDFSFIGIKKVFSYHKYIERLLGINHRDSIWRFLFAGRWKEHDNTLEGALSRAQLVIDGKYPGDGKWTYKGYEEGWHKK